jgi:hypothetical protein
MSFLFAFVAFMALPVEPPDTLVICPADFRVALQPWVEYRQQQGHCIAVVAPPDSSYGIKHMVQKFASSGRLKNVVLIGDSGDAHGSASRLVPTDYVKAVINVKYGSEPEIATDNTYADPDDDGIPELAIGRIPVDTPEQLTQMVNRIKEYESDRSNGAWQRNVNFIAGVGGFGPLLDKLIEQTTKQIITDLIPSCYRTTMTYGSWTSPYCPDPRRFAENSIDRFNEGCLFWVYIGHGARHKLDKIYLPDQSHTILDCRTAYRLNCREGSPIAIFLSCYTGATDDEQDCLAEEMLNQPRGPIAMVCGTRVTMPYAMGVLSLEIMKEFFDGDAPTLGELIRVGKVRMMEPFDEKDVYRNMIEGMGKAFSPNADSLVSERREHVDLIHLLGDPLLRLKRPDKVELQAPPLVNAGDSIQVTGNSPAAGKLVLEVCYARDRFRVRPPRRKDYDSSESSFQSYQKTYESTQQLVCYRETIDVNQGPFETDFQIPREANGDCVVRAVLLAAGKIGLGSSPIEITAFHGEREAKKTVVDSLEK